MQDTEIATMAQLMLDSHGGAALPKALHRADDNEARGHPAAAAFWRRTAAKIREIEGMGMVARG